MLFLLALLALPFVGAAPYDVPLGYAPPVLSLDVRLLDPPTWELVMPAESPREPVADDAVSPVPVTIERGYSVELGAATRIEARTRAG